MGNGNKWRRDSVVNLRMWTWLAHLWLWRSTLSFSLTLCCSLSAHHWVELSWWLKMTPSFTLNPTLSFCFPMDYLKSFLNSLIFTNKLNIYLYSAWWLNALQEEGTLSVTTPLRTRLFRWMKISTQFLLFRVRNRYVE